MTEKLRMFLESLFLGGKQNNEVEWAILKAYSDLKRNIPYKYSLAELKRPDISDDKKKQFNELKTSFISGVVKQIGDGVKDKKTPRCVINLLCKKSFLVQYEELFKKEFTVGLAQKWVNMSYKYLWLIDKCPIKEELLDAPLDEYIISAITQDDKSINEHGISIKLSTDEQNVIKWNKEENVKNGSVRGKKWSTLNEISTYEKIQKRIKESIGEKYNSVIEWENYAWTRQLIIEKNKK